MSSKKTVVLAFSGGLDTSFCVPYLIEKGYEVITLFVDTGGVGPGGVERIAARAKELGAEKDPKAQLHVKLAEEQIAQGKVLIKDENNRRADMVLQRATADAEYALILAKEKAAKEELEQLHQKLNALKSGK